MKYWKYIIIIDKLISVIDKSLGVDTLKMACYGHWLPTNAVSWMKVAHEEVRLMALTAQVLLSLKIGALCKADTTDTRAWRLFSSKSFCDE